MKTNYIIIHGTYGKVTDNWFLWLKQEIENLGHECLLPSFITDINIDNYHERRKILKDYYDQGLINENTVFIAHSSGPIAILKFLIEEQINVKGLISISGFNNADTPYEDYNKINKDFFLDDHILEKAIHYTKFICSFYSNNDPYLKYEDLERFANITKAEKYFVKYAGHFNKDSGYTEFPAILKILKQVEDGISLMEEDDLPIGINFLIQNDKKEILLGRRINRFGEGTYSLIGGKLKNNETIENCCIRELKEEIDLEVTEDSLEVVNIATTITNQTFMQIGVMVKKYKGTPKIMEPNKCDDLRFFSLDNLPELFIGTKPNIELLRDKKVYGTNYNYINKDKK